MDQSLPVNACVCALCKNHTPNTFNCKAFPGGIPDKVLFGENDHSKPIEGDNGIQFEPIEEEAKKTADEIKWTRNFEITKTDTEKRYVFGWASVAIDKEGNQVEDTQEDLIDEAEIEQAAYNHVLYARKAGEMHRGLSGDLIESMIFTKEKQEALKIPEGTLPGCAWWVGYHISKKDAWEKVKSGEYSMFSIGGRGRREEVKE